MTSLNENIFRVTGPLWRESTVHRWISFTKANDAKLWYFLWSALDHTVDQPLESPVLLDAIALTMTSLQWLPKMLLVIKTQNRAYNRNMQKTSMQT